MDTEYAIPLRLDLGAGETSPPGYVPRGALHGSAIYPLPCADGTVDAIRASHVLEHFPHGEIGAVLADWVRALRPGGTLRLAVPDFARIAESYLAGAAQPTESWIMGGQSAEDDFHRSLFDERRLKAAMAAAGLVLLRPWTSEIADCAALPISLNLEGTKPHRAEINVRGVMTAPRLGFNDMWNCAVHAFPRCGIDFTSVNGAFWDQSITLAIERQLADPGVDYLVTADYDSVFHAGHVATLLQLAMAHPEADAIAPLQSSRHGDNPLFGLAETDGERTSDGRQVEVDRAGLEVDLRRVRQAHFGLTLINAEKLRALPRPWFRGVPNADGAWAEGKLDPDVHFWRRWEAAGHSLMLAPRVVIGHLELMVRWPGQDDLRPVWQQARAWEATRRPPDDAWTGVPA